MINSKNTLLKDIKIMNRKIPFRGGSRGRVQGVRTLPRDYLRFSHTTGILQKKKKTMWFIGVEVEQETGAPPPKKNPGSAPALGPYNTEVDEGFYNFPEFKHDPRFID